MTTPWINVIAPQRISDRLDVTPPSPLRLRLDAAALADNWRLLARMSGRAACGAALKADGYGLGAVEVAHRLAAAGARDVFVATWAEAEALAPIGLSVSVLHGVRDEDMPAAMLSSARPVLNTPAQVARWRMTGRPCDVMIDTGINRLGLSVVDVHAGLLDGLAIDTLMSHLASADEDSALNQRQQAAFAALAGQTGARRMSLANSAGIALGADYAFDLTRPGLALYGGVPRAELAGIRQVAFLEAQVVQRRRVRARDSVGYNATFTAPADMDIAILNIGYADGYWRGFSNQAGVIGRVSMDLLAVPAGDLAEGDWAPIDFALPDAARRSGLSQYELLTGLGNRFERIWT